MYVFQQSEVAMIDMKRIKQPPVLETIKESYSLENSRNNLHVVDPPASDVDKGWYKKKSIIGY